VLEQSFQDLSRRPAFYTPSIRLNILSGTSNIGGSAIVSRFLLLPFFTVEQMAVGFVKDEP